MRFATQSLANNTNCTNDDTLLNCLRDLDGEVLLNEYFSSSFVSSSPKVRLAFEVYNPKIRSHEIFLYNSDLRRGLELDCH